MPWLSTAIDLDDPTASVMTALSVSGYFRLTAAEARAIIGEVEQATANWQREATAVGLPRQQIDLMATAYDSTKRQEARTIA